MKFKILIFLIPFLSLLHGQRGPQDTWYEAARVPMPSGCSPHDLIVTPEGTLLLTDTGNDKIHELEANGTLIRSFGAPGSGNGQFNNPVELAMGPNNRIYVTDQDNHRIQVLERDGTFVKAFGTNGTGDGQFNQPRGLGISLDNEVFVSEVSNHRVQVFDADGNFLRKWGSLGNLDGQMNKPYSLEVDEDRKVFVTDYENKRINVFSKTGELLYKIGTSRTFSWSSSVAFLKLQKGGTLVTGGETTGYNQDFCRLREKNGALLKTINFGIDGSAPYNGTWSPSTQLLNGTIVSANKSSNKLIFLEQTYRTLKPATPKNLPLVDVISVKQPAGTDHLEIKYRITDTDSSTVNCGLLAFKDGGNDLSKLIIPSTFVGSTTGKLGPSTTTGTTHTVTWDAAADWDVLFGDVEIAVVAQDDRELMNFHFLTLPATDTNSTELKINRSPVGHGDFKNAWYTLLALGDSGITLDGNEVKSTSGPYYTTNSGTETSAEGKKYLLNKMNLREATAAEIERAKEGATPGVINKFEPSFKVGPDERPNKVNEYGFDTGGSGFWVVDANSGGTHTAQLSSDVALEMIWVDPGTFMMGQDGVATPVHEVTLTSGFYLGKYEVTQAQYEAVMTGNTDGLSATPSQYGGNPNRPVEKVTWDDIQKFLTRLNAQESGNIPAGWSYVLPTEAQWEYACRAGTTTAYSWGDSITTSNANYGSNIGQTADVGQYAANPWGFFDMHGNVWEWTADALGSYASGAQTDPFNAGSSGSNRVFRGGVWFNAGTSLRSAARSGSPPNFRLTDFGFRVGFQQQ